MLYQIHLSLDVPLNYIHHKDLRFILQNVLYFYAQMLEQHLKTCTLHTEEEGQRIGTGNKQPFRINTSSAIFPDPSHCAILHSLQHISDHRNNVAEGKNLQFTTLHM